MWKISVTLRNNFICTIPRFVHLNKNSVYIKESMNASLIIKKKSTKCEKFSNKFHETFRKPNNVREKYYAEIRNTYC